MFAFKTLALALACVASASAFVAAPRAGRATVRMAADLDSMVGVGPESGNKVWDPMSFGSVSKVIAGEHSTVMPDVKWLREAEIKHGRVCMLAFVGTCFAANGVVFPGDLGGFHYEACAWYDGLASGLSTNSFGMAQLLMTIGLIEVRTLIQTTCRPTPNARCRHCRPWTELRKASPQRHGASHVPDSTF